MILGISFVFAIFYLFKVEKINLAAAIFLVFHPLVSYLDLKFIFGMDPLELKIFYPLCVWTFGAGIIGLWKYYKKKEMGRHLPIIMAVTAICEWNGGDYILLAGILPLIVEEYRLLAKRHTTNPNTLTVILVFVSFWFLTSTGSQGFWVNVSALFGAVLLSFCCNLRYLMAGQVLLLFFLSSAATLEVLAGFLFYLTTTIYFLLIAPLPQFVLLKRFSEHRLLAQYKTFWALINRGIPPLFPTINRTNKIQIKKEYINGNQRQEYLNFSVLSLGALVLISLFISLLGAADV